MINRIGAALVAGAVVALCTPALAQPRHCPPGHAKKGWCNPGGYQSRGFDRYEDRYERRRARGDHYDYGRRSSSYDRRWGY